MRTIVIGDVHGCIDELKDLLEKVKATKEDRVIFTGDLVDRGPDSAGCVDIAMKYESVMGNHEKKHLKIRMRPENELIDDHKNTRNALQNWHYNWIEKLPLYISIPEHNAVVVHAGVLPWRHMKAQPPYVLLHGQCLDPVKLKETQWPSKSPPEWKFWTNHWQGPERVIFGHTVLDKPLLIEFACGIDTGGVFGYSLTAVILPSWEFVQVPARKVHYPSNRIGKIDIGNGVCCFS